MDPIEINPNAVYTLDDAAKILHVSKPTVYRWCRTGSLKFSRLGRAYRFLGSALISSLEAANGVS